MPSSRPNAGTSLRGYQQNGTSRVEDVQGECGGGGMLGGGREACLTGMPLDDVELVEA
jgi:hypothetical protein